MRLAVKPYTVTAIKSVVLACARSWMLVAVRFASVQNLLPPRASLFEKVTEERL